MTSVVQDLPNSFSTVMSISTAHLFAPVRSEMVSMHRVALNNNNIYTFVNVVIVLHKIDAAAITTQT